MNKTRIVGHRGSGTLAPENSLSGFRMALGLGLDAVEFDVHLLRDGALAVLHDPYLERTTVLNGVIGDLTAGDLKKATLKGGQECVPTFPEVLDIVATSTMELHIEIKTDARGEPYEGIAERVLAEIRQRGLEERAIFTSFTPLDLQRIRALSPAARVLCSINRTSAEAMGGFTKAVAAFRPIEGCFYAIERQLLATVFDEVAASIGRERLGAWLTNQIDVIEHWLAKGIRQITTDHPDIAVKARGVRRMVTTAEIAINTTE